MGQWVNTWLIWFIPAGAGGGGAPPLDPLPPSPGPPPPLPPPLKQRPPPPPVHSAHCTPLIAHYTLYRATEDSISPDCIWRIPYRAHWTLCAVRSLALCSLHTAQCTLCNLHNEHCMHCTGITFGKCFGLFFLPQPKRSFSMIFGCWSRKKGSKNGPDGLKPFVSVPQLIWEQLWKKSFLTNF